MDFIKSRLLLVLISLFFVGNIFATDLYWVGNSGNWNDPSHWSTVSGGNGGAGIPTGSDNIFVDQNSFTLTNQALTLNSDVSLNNLSITDNCKPFELTSTNPVTVEIYGELNVSIITYTNNLTGLIKLKSPSNGSKTLNFGNWDWKADIIFDGNGIYKLNSQLLFNKQTVSLNKGELDLNSNSLICGTFKSNSGLKRKLSAKNATILCYNEWNSNEMKFNHDLPQSTIYLINSDKNALNKGNGVFLVKQSKGSNNKNINNITLSNDTVSCGNNCDGTLIVNFTTTCPNAFVDWLPGPSANMYAGECFNCPIPGPNGSNTITNLCPGNYQAVISNDCDGNIQVASAKVEGHDVIVELIHTEDPISCKDICDGSAFTFVTGAPFADFSYLWFTTGNPADTTTSLSGLCDGLYQIEVRDGFGCVDTFDFNITEPDSLYANVTVIDPLCFSYCTGSATSNPIGGNGGYSYLWSPQTGNPAIDTAQTFPNLCAGNSYTVTVTDSKGCVNDTTITPNQPPQIQLDTVVSNVKCGGDCDGTITVTVLSGGTAPYSHHWSTGAINNGSIGNITGLCPGNYTDTIIDGNGCDTIISFTITEPTILTTTTIPTDVTCNGACNGKATTFPVGGAGGYTYSWSCGPSTFDSITNLCPTPQCIVTITDANLCTVSDTFSISEPPPIIVNPSSTNVTCPGFCDGTATVNPTGGTGNPVVNFTYTWTGPGGPYNTQSIGSLCPGTYIITVRDSFNCVAVDSITITQSQPLSLIISGTDESCSGSCDGTAAVLVSGGTTPYNYIWTSIPVGQVSSGQGTDSIFNLCAGTYTVNITDSSGCPANASVTINPQSPISGNLVSTNLTCNGICNGTATVSPTGGVGPYTVSWDGAPAIAIPIAGSNTINGLCAGSHTALITDFNNCTVLINFNITQPPALLTNTNTTDVTCFGDCDGTAKTIPNGGVAPYVFSWNSIPANPPFPIANDSIGSLCAGTYYVIVTDDSLCTVNDTIIIIEPAQIFPNAQFTNITCNNANNGTAISIPTGGVAPYTYSWSGPGGPYNSQSIGPLGPGQYIVTVTDTNGCIGIDTINITNPPVFTVSAAATNASCGTVCDGTAFATPNGGTPGYTYSWNTVPVQTTQGATGLCAGTYTVTVTDTNGCTAQDTTVINNLITIQINPSIIGISCNGICDGQATAIPSGGLAPYTYSWSNGDTTQTADSLCPGKIYVTVTDMNGCSTTDSIMMPVAPSVLVPNGIIVQPISCNGVCDGKVSSSPTGGTQPYTVVWNLPNGIDTNNVCAGVVTVTVTDSNNCVQTDTLVLIAPDTISPNATIVNVKCNGNSTGSITLNPSGGTPGYSYVWVPNVSTSSSATNLPAGNYSITITDTNGCSRTNNYIITQPPALSSTPIGVNISCNGACDGMAAVIVGGGTPPYLYNWAPNGQTNDTIFNLCPPFLTNTVTIIDSNGCLSSKTITITEPSPLNAGITGTPVGCSSVCDGTAIANPTGGTPGYTYQWSANAAPNNLNGQSINNLCPDTFTVTVTDTNGCTAIGTYIVTSPPALAVTLNSTNVTCNGANNGTATAIPTGGTAPYTYSWVGGCLATPNTNPSISGLCPGVYTVTVTDSANCIFIGSVIITEPTPINDNEVVTLANCGICDGSIVMFPSGGTPGYSHSWSNGVTTPNNPNLCAGFYTDTITDSQGCIALFTIAVSNPTGPSGITGTVNDVTCYGACNGSLNAIPIGGTKPYSFSWTSIPPGGPYPNDSTLTGLCAGTYNLTVTDGASCILTTTLVVSQADSITANPIFTNANCNGSCDGTANVTPTGGTAPYTYLWSHNGSTASSASGLCAGPVSVTITDNNGCTKVINFNITSPNALSISSTTTDAQCNGNCDGTATANPLGGTAPYTYQWSDPLAQTTPTATGLCAGTYIVTVTDAGGCSGNDTVVINEPSLIVPNAVTTLATCGICDGTITLSPTGGTGPYTYNWPSIGATTPTVNALCAGTYTVEITDANLCKQIFLIAVSNVNGPVVSVNKTNATCSGVCDGQATATVTSGTPTYQYLWTAGGQTTPTATGLCAGSYTIQVTDGNGCKTVMPVTITENNPITAAVTTIDATCNGACDGSALVIPSGGVPPYAYSWVGGNATGQTINAVGGLCAGNYTVTITDALGCSFIQNVVINQSNILSVTAIGIAANCNNSCDGSATANPIGGTAPYTYLWSTGGTTPTVTALCAGTYTVTITDANGCTANAIVTIGDGIAITGVLTSVDATCGQCDGSASIVAGGGSGAPFTYSWSPGGQTTPSINNLCPGAYNVTVTDNLGCTQLFTILVNNANGPTLNTQADSVSCFGACDGLAFTTVLAGNPNYIFQWDDPLLQTNDSANALCAGLYTVVVQDALGCITVDSVTVEEPLQILANVTFTNPSCIGICDGTATVTPSGGVGPYVILWGPSAANQATPTATALCVGTHLVTITDSKGCSITDSVTLTNPTPISITLSSTPPTCNGDCDGTAIANASGGTPGYQYSWNTVPTQSNSLAASLCAGTYIVTVTDNKGCSDTASVQVIDPPVLSTSSTPTSPTCNGLCDGSITTNPLGGAAPYTYIWSNGDTTQTTSTTLCAGTYIVIVIDANNCTAYDTITLTPAPMLNDSTVVNQPNCGLCDGSATSTPVGGVGPFDFVWTNPLNPVPPLQVDLGVASSTIIGLCAGTLNLQITDLGTGCIYNYTVLVSNANGPSLNLSATDETCPNLCNGTATAIPTGGTAPYIYSWSPTGPPTDTNQTATSLCVGTYTVTVTDSNNCITIDTISINSRSLNLSIVSIVPETCFGNCDGSATVNITNGTAPFTYSWMPTAPVQTTPSATGLCVGNYIVTVTDSTNCSDSISANITGPNILTVNASLNNPITCNSSCNGSAVATVLGGTPNYTYQWNDPLNQTTPVATGLCAGTYIVTVTDNNGCTAMDTITLTEPAAILANEVLTTPNCGLCDGTITIAPSGGTGPYTFLWTTPSAPPSPKPITSTLINLCPGAYSVTITDSTGCVANFNFPLSSTLAPIPNTTVTNASCNGDCNGIITAAPTGGTAPYSYFWTPTGDTTISITGLCTGVYSLNVTDSNGCVGVAIDSITQPEILQANISASNLTCNGTCDGWAVANPIGGTSPYTYNWIPGNLPQDSITNLCAGTYYVTVTDSNNCMVTDSITIIEPGAITATNTTTDASCSSVCDGSATVTPTSGVGPYTYQWNGNTTPGQTNTQNNLCFGTNLVLITDANGCTFTDTITIAATDTVQANAGNDTIICLGTNYILIGTPTGNFTSVEWFALPAMTSLGTTNSISITPNATGTFCFVFQVNGACISTDTVCITVDPLPIANAGPDVSIFEFTNTTLNASGGGTYSWSPGSSLNDSTIYNPVASPSETTTYYVTVTSPNGCTATDSVIVTVLPNIKFPDGITPNGDGKNDYWVIDFIEQFPKNVVEIYNRWGELLFHADGYKQNWDGHYNGKELPIGTYYYIIDLHEEKIAPFTGPITILR